MKTTVIGPSRIRVSSIGLGCVTFGREIDEAAAHTLLDDACARGVCFFDTAAAYGNGKSEQILGSWLATHPSVDSLTIATKVLPPYTPANIEDSVKQSLQRLAVPRIDLLYLHRWDATAESPDTLAALSVLVAAGKVRALGVSNYNLSQLAKVVSLQADLGLEPFRVVQNNHNLAVSDVSLEFRSFCAARDIVIVTYSPLGAGFLTGKHQRGVSPGSRFDLVPGHQDVYFHEPSRRRLAQLEAVAARTGHSQAHLALAWALHEPGITSVLVGGRTPAHLHQALAAQSFDDPALFAELTAE